MLSLNRFLFLVSIAQFTLDPAKCLKLFAYDESKDPKSVCFEEVGCFSMEPPWKNFLRPIPRPDEPSKLNVSLKLVTRNFLYGQDIAINPPSSKEFDSARLTVFIAHGYAANLKSEWTWRMARAYLSLVDSNVFLIDWSMGGSQSYLKSASNIRVVAAQVASYIFFLQRKEKLGLSNVHFIGHGLGAHLCAYIAKALTTDDQKIDRITGLDPSQALFEGTPPEVRLANTDANYVEVIHTSAKPLTSGGLGMISPIGAADYFINKGYDQPGCGIESLKFFRDLIDRKKNKMKDSDPGPCSHYRAAEIYIASLEMYHTSCRFMGIRPKSIPKSNKAKEIELVESCTLDSCIPIDLRSPLSPARGVFYVETDTEYPFCNELTEKTVPGAGEVMKFLSSNPRAKPSEAAVNVSKGQ